MTKDAKGHGSESHGGSFQDVARQHQMKIARSTVKMPAAMAAIMGGMTPAQAHALIQQHGSVADKAMAAEYAKIPDSSAAAALASGPKSAAVATHPAMASVAPSANHPGLGERGGAVSEEVQNRSGVAWARDRTRFHEPSSPEYVGKNKRF